MQYSRKLLIENSGECPPRSGGWRARSDHSYLAANILGLVCHINDSDVTEYQLRSSCMPNFLDVLVLLVTYINRFLGPFRIFWRSHSRRVLVF